MMQKYFLVLFLLLVLAIAPSSAAYTNTTQLGLSSAGFYATVSVVAGGTNVYNPSLDTAHNYDKSPSGLVQTTFKTTNDATSLLTTYTFKSGNTVSITTTSVTTGLLTAEYHVLSSNGITAVIPYYLYIPWSGSNAPQLQTRYLYSNETQTWYLYTGVQGKTGNPLNLATESFAVVPPPSADPIVSVMQHPGTTGSLQATYFSVPVAELPSDTQNTEILSANGGTTENVWESLGKILAYIQNSIISLMAILGKAGSLFSITSAVFLFLTAGEIFLGINVFYMLIAIVLSIEDSDDIFRSFGSFVRRMQKLLRFYMEIFVALKEIIKWW